MFGHRAAVGRAVRRGHIRRDGSGVIAVHGGIGRIRITAPLGNVSAERFAGGFQCGQGDRIGFDDARLRTELGGHVAQGQALVHRQGLHRAAAVFEHPAFVAHAVLRAQHQHDVLGADTVGQLAVNLDAGGLRHAQPDLAGDQGTGDVGGAHADHERAEGAAAGRVRIPADTEHARLHVAMFLQHHMADAEHVVMGDPGLARPVAGQGQDVGTFHVHGRHEVVGDHHDLVRVPDRGTELFQPAGDPARAAGVMHHQQVQAGGEDFTGTDACLATGAGQDFFSKGGAQAELSIGSGV